MLPALTVYAIVDPSGDIATRADVLQLHDVVERHRALVLRAGGGGRGEQREDACRSARQ